MDFNDYDISEIILGKLYLSSLHCRHEEMLLHHLHISVICDLTNLPHLALPKYSGINYHEFYITDDVNNEDSKILAVLGEVADVVYGALFNGLADGDPSLEADASVGAVLVPCNQGISRSATAIIYFLLTLLSTPRHTSKILVGDPDRAGILRIISSTDTNTDVVEAPQQYQQSPLRTLKACFEYVRSRRRIILPNLAFMKILQRYELKLTGQNTVQFGPQGQIYWTPGQG
jgi:hypothetical protein